MIKWTARALPCILLATLSVHAFEYAEDTFFIVAHGLLTATRLDPIMSPGDLSGHVHTIVGGSGFGPTYDYDKSLDSQCTSSNIAVDHSNYWTPQLYNKHKDGTFTAAPLYFANTYYLLRRPGDEPVHEFPPGFRMLAGDQDRTTLDESDPTHTAINYLCLGTDEVTYEFPKTKCEGGVRAQAFFPHCWDGVNSWLEGSKHVTYGEGPADGGGKCPPTHPKRLMSIFYEFIFVDTEPYEPGARVWSNGDDTGYGLHADFTNGWPEGFFSEIWSHGRACSVAGELADCPALAPHVQEKGQCKYTGVTIDEDIGDKSPLAKLPGNNPSSNNYEETAKFNSGSPAPTQIDKVAAPTVIMGSVKGDPPASAPPDAIAQTGQAKTTAAAAVASASVTAPAGGSAASPEVSAVGTSRAVSVGSAGGTRQADSVASSDPTSQANRPATTVQASTASANNAAPAEPTQASGGRPAGGSGRGSWRQHDSRACDALKNKRDVHHL